MAEMSLKTLWYAILFFRHVILVTQCCIYQRIPSDRFLLLSEFSLDSCLKRNVRDNGIIICLKERRVICGFHRFFFLKMYILAKLSSPFHSECIFILLLIELRVQCCRQVAWEICKNNDVVCSTIPHNYLQIQFCVLSAAYSGYWCCRGLNSNNHWTLHTIQPNRMSRKWKLQTTAKKSDK